LNSPKLLRRQGYSATTIEQISEAAEVSESTFFRYFPTKEAVVPSDEYDPLIAEAFRAQPAHLGTVQAMRRAIWPVFEPLGAEEIADMRERAVLSMQVPEVWGAALVNMMETSQLLAELVAERLGRKATDVHPVVGRRGSGRDDGAASDLGRASGRRRRGFRRQCAGIPGTRPADRPEGALIPVCVPGTPCGERWISEEPRPPVRLATIR
jgi:AcrR family transcriptional regulator